MYSVLELARSQVNKFVDLAAAMKEDRLRWDWIYHLEGSQSTYFNLPIDAQLATSGVVFANHCHGT
jgi:hypothetical protein